MSENGKEPLTIGWTEYVELPEWGVRGMRAKIDTGARTSALDVQNITEHDDGTVEFYVIVGLRPKRRRRHIRTEIVKRAKVRSSTGVYSTRCFVRTPVRIGDVTKEIELTLVERKKMLFRMLIGRKALEGDFLVDVSRRWVTGRPPKKEKKVS